MRRVMEGVGWKWLRILSSEVGMEESVSVCSSV